MGRGVETIGENILYFDASDEHYQDSFAWDDLIENLQFELSAAFSSLETCEKWHNLYRESHGFLWNDFVTVYISRYCGCGAISIATEQAEYPELAEYWLSQIWERLVKIIGGHVDLLNRIGTFSNGCGVFEKAKK